MHQASTTLESPEEAITPRHLFKFLIPSLIGVGLFLVPITLDGDVNIVMGLIAGWLQTTLGAALPALASALFCLSALLSLWVKLARPAWAGRGVARELFDVGLPWLLLRLGGALCALLILFQVGPEFIIADYSGGVMLNDLMPVLLTFFFVAALFLPLLVDYGFMEFVGSLVRKPFRVIFRLPGRSALDATASWMGAGSVGVIITAQQYDKGYYSGREAAVIAANFSIVSIAFALVVANFLKIGHLFVPFYATVVVAGITAAILTPRLPPLSRKADRYHEPVGCQLVEQRDEGCGLLRFCLRQATRRAARAPGPRTLIRHALLGVADIVFALLPLVMAIGTLALVLAEFTPIFTWLSYPMVPVLEWLRIPEAEAAAPATLVGFADMFLPAVLASGIESELTRFVIGCLSLTQLIYMSEIGALILKSRIPLRLWELFVIFLLRTAITLPIIALIAHTLVF